MIYYDHLPLSEDILKALAELNIDYVFQPIFHRDGKTIYAHEALMRPKNMTVTELIDEYIKMDKLHVIEVATFFGASQAFVLRGYKEKLSINSFPCEIFTKEEYDVYIDYFGGEDERLIIEMLEYPRFSIDCVVRKQEISQKYHSIIAMDDYGSGLNDMSKMNIMKPHIVKLDRSLISNIDKDLEKQAACLDAIATLHDLGKLVVAEGIETKEEFDYLVSIGADLFQGYYLARPA